MSLSIESRHIDARAVVIVLRGKLAYDTAPDVRFSISLLLISGEVDAIVVDLAGVTFLDATGIGTLVVAQRICRDLDVEFRVCNPNLFVAKLFTVLGVAEVLGVPPVLGLRPRRRPEQPADGHPESGTELGPLSAAAVGEPGLPTPAPTTIAPEAPAVRPRPPEGNAPGFWTAAAP